MDQGQVTSRRPAESALENISESRTLDPDVRRQQVELIYTQAPAAMLAALAIAMLITAGLWGIVEHV